MKEKQKLWFIAAGVTAILGVTVVALKRISNFVDQFSYQPTVKRIQIVNSNIFNIPPILGNALITLNMRIDNPLAHSHTLSDLSVRIYETTSNGDTQIGNSLPKPEKYHIAASGSTVIQDIQLVVPVSSLIGLVNVDVVKQMIQAQSFVLNRSFKIRVDVKCDGIAGNTETTIKL